MLKQANAISEELIEWRRDFHMHPEIAFDLHRTAGIVADELEKMGYRVKRGVGKTGVVAEIGEGGKVVAIRADMDALPIFEQNETDYISQNEGKMHACGHDSHTAMALGAAQILAKETLPGRVRFIFQPCEETADEEGKSGAQRMFEEGAVDGVDWVIAQHVDPTSPVGTIAINEGPSGGGVVSWKAVIHGKGGHGAYPHKSNDPFMLLAHVIMGINSIISRRLEPFEPAVISIGAVNGGFAENVIPDKVEMIGTIRFTSLEIEKQIREEMKRVFEIVKTLGGDYELSFLFGGLPTINDKQVAEMIAQVGHDLLGDGNVHPLAKTLGAEDFPQLLQNAPGAMYTLGTMIEGRPLYELHHPKFDLDERALPIGTAVLAETALRFLKK
ncbi:MAG TPA: M20 family metallopeptidase [Anaerolineales bacterium]|nr:M20 family metallopeptidase [Anaerolineales bacterium]HNB36093.1 M20 family metallopeptidase [Anaerolineales bacterium]HNC09158.1 M20 family metallopeptidase [Anaerolineales bacterium]